MADDETQDLEILAAQIRAARALLGISQAELSKHAKVNRSTIADLESAKRRPHEATIYVLMSELVTAGAQFIDGGGVMFRVFPPPLWKDQVSRTRPKPP